MPILHGHISGWKSGGGGQLQVKTATPTGEIQRIEPDESYYGLSAVVIEAIPPQYGLVTYNGVELTVS